MTLACDLLVNAAGLGAPALARSIEGMPIGLIPAPIWQGQLFQLQRAGPVFTPDLSGAGARRVGRAPDARHGGPSRFGPDVEWVESIDYAVDPVRAERFYPAIRRYCRRCRTAR